jgi:hypothetical protein
VGGPHVRPADDRDDLGGAHFSAPHHRDELGGESASPADSRDDLVDEIRSAPDGRNELVSAHPCAADSRDIMGCAFQRPPHRIDDMVGAGGSSADDRDVVERSLERGNNSCPPTARDDLVRSHTGPSHGQHHMGGPVTRTAHDRHELVGAGCGVADPADLLGCSRPRAADSRNIVVDTLSGAPHDRHHLVDEISRTADDRDVVERSWCCAPHPADDMVGSRPCAADDRDQLVRARSCAPHRLDNLVGAGEGHPASRDVVGGPHPRAADPDDVVERCSAIGRRLPAPRRCRRRSHLGGRGYLERIHRDRQHAVRCGNGVAGLTIGDDRVNNLGRNPLTMRSIYRDTHDFVGVTILNPATGVALTPADIATFGIEFAWAPDPELPTAWSAAVAKPGSSTEIGFFVDGRTTPLQRGVWRIRFRVSTTPTHPIEPASPGFLVV